VPASLWTGFARKIGEQWAAALLTPAFAFWAGGLVAWAAPDRWHVLDRWLHAAPLTVVIAAAVGALILVVISGAIVQRLTLPLLRLLEGYWPPWLGPLRRALVQVRGRRLSRSEQRWQALAAAADRGDPDARGAFVALDAQLRRVPARANDRMPTRLGDVLRAAETWPTDKYGLDAPKCWPRIWLVLPETARRELSDARSSLDQGAATWLWGLLFAVWIPWGWWAAIVAVAVPAGAYLWMLAAASVYGDLIESAFDVHRAALYEAVGYRPPSDPALELEAGRALTAYLWHGTPPPPGVLRPVTDDPLPAATASPRRLRAAWARMCHQEALGGRIQRMVQSEVTGQIEAGDRSPP
jgi:hypothetical protein